MLYNTPDGYENLVTTAQLDTLMPGDLEPEELKPITVPQKVVGKTINGVYWYAVCHVSAEDALKIKAMADKYDAKIMVGFAHYYRPAYQKMLELVDVIDSVQPNDRSAFPS